MIYLLIYIIVFAIIYPVCNYFKLDYRLIFGIFVIFSLIWCIFMVILHGRKKLLVEKEKYKPINYFVDPDNGSDSNSGLSETDAWKSVARINSASLQTGDIVNFKNGVYPGILIEPQVDIEIKNCTVYENKVSYIKMNVQSIKIKG